MMRRRWIVTGLIVALLGVSQPCRADSSDGSSYGSDAGYGVLAVVSNVVYMPLKVVYAGLGAVTGGLAWVLTIGNSDVAEAIWSPSMGGTYVVTPAMLRGEEELLVNGPSHPAR